LGLVVRVHPIPSDMAKSLLPTTGPLISVDGPTNFGDYYDDQSEENRIDDDARESAKGRQHEGF
jgi:hypothetical protein